MRHSDLIVLLSLALVSFPWIIRAQGAKNREIILHKNVRLIEIPVPPDLPEELVGKYQHFLPILEDVLRRITVEEPPECALTIRVAAGMKEIGTVKLKRVYASVTAFRQKSNREFMGNLYLHSFVSGETVSKEETREFLQKQILSPARCQPDVIQTGAPLGSLLRGESDIGSGTEIVRQTTGCRS
jgi:hypothetical protein